MFKYIIRFIKRKLKEEESKNYRYWSNLLL